MKGPAAAVVGAILSLGMGGVGRAESVRTMTDLDDAFACQPLDDGRLAIGTGGGLALVEPGGAVRVLTSMDGLPGTRVDALAREGDSLWVGTESGAAVVGLGGDPAVMRAVAMDSVPVRAILPTPSGVYLGTWGAGVLRAPEGGGAAESVRGAGGATRAAALAMHEGALYVAFADGPPARLENGALRPLQGAPSHGQALASVASASGKSLLLGDLEGLFRVKGDGAREVSAVDARAIVASDGRTWVGTFGSGLLVDGQDGSWTQAAELPRFVRGVGASGSTRCVATPQGAFVARAGDRWRRVPLGRAPSNDVTALAVDGDRVALGTFDRGAAIYERGSLRPVAGVDANESVEALAWGNGGAGSGLWIATAHGLLRTADDGSVRRWGTADGLPSSFVRTLRVLADGRLLVGTDAGPAYLEGDRVTPFLPGREGAAAKGRARPLESPMRATWALAQSADGTLWVGTTAGLYYGRGPRLQRAAVATGELADDWVTALAVDATGVFVGTYSGGVTRLRRGADGLHATHLGGGYVNPDGLAIVGRDLVAATMEGALVRPLDDDGAAWRPKAGAAPGRDVTAVKQVGPATWFASRRGIAVWTP